MFRRVRQLQEENKELIRLVLSQQDRIHELEWRLASERQTVIALQAECDIVRTATENMSKFVRESEGALAAIQGEGKGWPSSLQPYESEPDSPTGDSRISGEHGLEAMVTDAWVYQGVQTIFDMFDTNKDGLLDVDEMNALQVGILMICLLSVEPAVWLT